MKKRIILVEMFLTLDTNVLFLEKNRKGVFRRRKKIGNLRGTVKRHINCRIVLPFIFSFHVVLTRFQSTLKKFVFHEGVLLTRVI